MLKKVIKSLLPPIILNRLRAGHFPWRGDYSSWSEALSDSSGYDGDEIAEKVFQSTVRLLRGDGVYERDSVLFDQVQYSWPLVSALLATSLESQELQVLDFGGALGSSFYQNQEFLRKVKTYRWYVVEQKSFLDKAKKLDPIEHLFFKNNMREVFAESKINFVLFSSVLQYLENPYEVLDEVMSYSPQAIFLDRVLIVEGDRDIITKQSVSGDIYQASYPCRLMTPQSIFSTLEKKYRLVSDFKSFVDIEGSLNNKYRVSEKGFYFELKS